DGSRSGPRRACARRRGRRDPGARGHRDAVRAARHSAGRQRAHRRRADLPARAGGRPDPGGRHPAPGAGAAHRHRPAGAAAPDRAAQQRDVVRGRGVRAHLALPPAGAQGVDRDALRPADGTGPGRRRRGSGTHPV
ncbi:MAG: putative membrane protein, partial [uncultured Blastococcus sp.]